MTVQGMIGLALAAVGLFVGVYGHGVSEQALTQDTRARLRNKQAPIGIAVIVMAVAVATYFILRARHHGVLGLRICIGVLVTNAIVVRLAKVALSRPILDEDDQRMYVRYVTLEAAGFLAMFGGAYLYLTR